jgi:hypothetical protein
VNNNLIGQMDEEIQKMYMVHKEILATFAKAEPTGPNTVYFSKKSKPKFKIQ